MENSLVSKFIPPSPRKLLRRSKQQQQQQASSKLETTNESSDDFPIHAKVSQTLPTKTELLAAGELSVLDKDARSIPFKNLFGNDKRVLVVFVRHFFCGNCQEYLRTLCSSISPATLAALPTPTELIVVGCGQPDLFAFYAAETACPFPLYSDPSRRLFAALGMARTLDLGSSSPSYMQQSLSKLMVRAIAQVLASGRRWNRGGNYWQVGGELLFEAPDFVSWCHRMTNTRDHAEVEEVRRVLGLDEAQVPTRKRWSLAPETVRRSWVGKRMSMR